MGIVRLLLAFSVLNAHVGRLFGFEAISGELAVQSFFVISGFYMSLVLGKKYSLDRAGITTFYRNRFLRLAPTYWLLLAICLIWPEMSTVSPYIPGGNIVTSLTHLPFFDACLIAISGVFLMGQDLLFFREISPDLSVHWSTHAGSAGLPLNSHLYISPSWSLALELWFYLVAPFFAGRRWKVIAGTCAASLAIRLVLADNGIWNDPWNFRFFPSEFLWFGLGMLAQRFHSANKSVFNRQLGLAALAFVVLGICFQSFIPLEKMMKHWVFLSLFVVAVPFIFDLTKNNSIDRFVGELSFPLYMCHAVVQHAIDSYWPDAGDWTAPSIASISIVIAIALNRGFEMPIEKIRQRGLQKLSLENQPTSKRVA